jgi:signal transduction histidine kinase
MGLRARIWPGLDARAIWFEAAVAVLGTVAVRLSAADASTGLVPEPVLLAGTVALAVLLLLFRRSAPLAPFLAGAALAAATASVSAGVLFTSYAVGRYVGRWPLRIGAAAIGAVAVAQPWQLGSVNEAVGAAGEAALVVVLPGAIGSWLRTRAELLSALRERADRAEAERELLAREAVLTERARVAREMHDAVGHRVSLMVLQAGAIEMAAADQHRVEQLAGQVQTAGRQALDELRQMVGVLRAGELDQAAPLGPQPGLEDLPSLVAESRAAGMSVELTGPPQVPLDPAVGRAAYRIVQEALTNAGKHAPGAAVSVSVQRPEGELVVRVVNGPGDRPAHADGGGYGLVGLGERVRTLGGRLTAGPRLDGGFAVEAVLPS